MKSITIVLLPIFLLAMACSRPPSSSDSLREKHVNAPGGLRMRSAPDLNAGVVQLVPDGAVVTVLSEQGEQLEISGKMGQWTHIRFSNQEGWVFGGFLIEYQPHLQTQNAAGPAVWESCPTSTGHCAWHQKNMKWRDASNYCQGKRTDATNWHLPTIEDMREAGPKLLEEQGSAGYLFWTSSPAPDGKYYAWWVDHQDGGVRTYSPETLAIVRCISD